MKQLFLPPYFNSHQQNVNKKLKWGQIHQQCTDTNTPRLEWHLWKRLPQSWNHYIRTFHYVNDFWWLFRIELSALFCSTHNGLIQFNRNSIMINDCNISTAMFVNGESNGKSIQRFILITQSHMITLAVPYIILSTILINGEPFSIMFSIFILSPDNTVRSLLLVQYPIWCFNEFYRKSTEILMLGRLKNYI